MEQYSQQIVSVFAGSFIYDWFCVCSHHFQPCVPLSIEVAIQTIPVSQGQHTLKNKRSIKLCLTRRDFHE